LLLPALRNPVVLAQQVATLDRISEGRFILGVGIATDVPNIRAEFEAAGVPFDKRVGRMVEGLKLCRALWTGKPVDWDGRWKLKGAVLGPTPHRPGGPPIWIAGAVTPARERTGRLYDGWFPNNPTAEEYPAQFGEVRAAARAAGRDEKAVTGAIYLTLAVDDDQTKAEARISSYLASYYTGMRPDLMRKQQRCFAGALAAAAQWLKSYAEAGASHMVLRFAGDHERHLDIAADIRRQLGW